MGDQPVEQRGHADVHQLEPQRSQVALGALVLALQVGERDGDRVLAELPRLPDRAAALVGEAVVTDPDANLVRRAPDLLWFDHAAQLARPRLDAEHATLCEALLAALEGLTARDHRDGRAMED